MFENGKIQVCDFLSDYISNVNSPIDNGSVAVVAGNGIKLTPLGYVNIPPPMSLENIQMSEGPYCQTWWKNYLFILTSTEIVGIQSDKRDYKKILALPFNSKSHIVKNFIFTASNNTGNFIINRIIEEDDNRDELIIVGLDFNLVNNELLFKLESLNETIKVIPRCHNLFNSVISDKLYDEKYFTKETEEKDDLFYGIEKHDEDEKYFFLITHHDKDKIFNKFYLSDLSISESSISTQFDIIKSRSVLINNDEKIVYLTKNNRLYLGNRLLGLDITSFEYFKKFLIVTQTSNTPYNTLHIIDLNNTDALTNSSSDAIFTPNFNYKTFTIRTIERGALITTVSRINLVLQMPRGNLETIYPRLLVLNLISELVMENKYGEAFELVRKHKINTSFLYDIDPVRFLSNIPIFISQLDKVYIIDFSLII
jgi:elongator complex protein 1